MKRVEPKPGDRVKMSGYATLYIAFMRCIINDQFDKDYYGTVVQVDGVYFGVTDGRHAVVDFDDHRLKRSRVYLSDLVVVSLDEDTAEVKEKENAAKVEFERYQQDYME